MKRIKVEKLSLGDIPQLAEWTAALSGRNNVDADVYEYPTLQVLKASNGRPISYTPFQTCWMLEALAFNPEATAQEKAAALRDTFTVIEFEARCQGIKEIYFLCADEEMKAFVLHHEFTAMTPATEDNLMQLFRKKL